MQCFLFHRSINSSNYSVSPFLQDTPSQRVQFILGTEDDDEHIPHDLFTEMDELCFRDGEEYEWRETARYVWSRLFQDISYSNFISKNCKPGLAQNLHYLQESFTQFMLSKPKLQFFFSLTDLLASFYLCIVMSSSVFSTSSYFVAC